ncbi:hypothetical protein [Actinosynnema mirum]|uniref:Uncharacterized protein n=1 Tax=Actinosynnema mirum (strain ATCC 29888 / DSM 43827 / JCM 3225 / NBRC 14064 / NCIMB 13271 / NRRL B-12336 / IMRU 3971 / 101) TaxID=446462 RepID=C6WE32_ACTMD|nr:hypothetical protein [Actinosynnema mirum]ACU35775.1 hypothetical protein Amir_1827 [Actinosynnema mirum DSM 43827]
MADGARGALALARMARTFTQDRLLDSAGFIGEALLRGHRLDLPRLEELHRSRLLVPLYRVVPGGPEEGRRVDVLPDGHLDRRREMRAAVREGRLRDCADELEDQPHERPGGERGPWWNGFLYSSWQLLDLHEVEREHRTWRAGVDRTPRLLHLRRRRALVLCALAPRYLPGVLGMEGVDAPGESAELAQLLAAAPVRPHDLRQFAEDLLWEARRDPLRRWLPLLRHSDHRAWSELRGEALDCLWLRVAAEVLLRAHEELALRGVVEPLPEVGVDAGAGVGADRWQPLSDRLGARREPLGEVLKRFGLL